MKKILSFLLVTITLCIALCSFACAEKHTHIKCEYCELCTDANCTGAESEKCQGHNTLSAEEWNGQLSAINKDKFNVVCSSQPANGTLTESNITIDNKKAQCIELYNSQEKGRTYFDFSGDTSYAYLANTAGAYTKEETTTTLKDVLDSVNIDYLNLFADDFSKFSFVLKDESYKLSDALLKTVDGKEIEFENIEIIFSNKTVSKVNLEFSVYQDDDLVSTETRYFSFTTSSFSLPQV